MYKLILVLVILLIPLSSFSSTQRRITAYDTDSLLLETDGHNTRVEILPSGEINFNFPLFLRDNKPIKFKELSSNGDNYVELKVPTSISDSFSITLPGFASAGGDVLVSNSSNELTWKHLPKVCIISESRDKGTDGDAAIKGEQDRKFDSTFHGDCSFFTRGSLIPDSSFISNSYFTSFELFTGRYSIQCMAYTISGVPKSQLYLWNVTANQLVTPVGLSGGASANFLFITLDIPSPTYFRLVHYTSKSRNRGLGNPTNATNSDREVYAKCSIIKF